MSDTSIACVNFNQIVKLLSCKNKQRNMKMLAGGLALLIIFCHNTITQGKPSIEIERHFKSIEASLGMNQIDINDIYKFIPEEDLEVETKSCEYKEDCYRY